MARIDFRDNAAKLTLLFIFSLFLIIALRLVWIQMFRGQYYGQIADTIRARIIPEIAPRGIIYDRYGKIMAESKVIYALDILPSQVKDMDFVLRFLRDIGCDTRKVEAKLKAKTYLPFELLRVVGELSQQQIGYIEENKQALDGVIISTRILRSYPENNVCSHVLGYVGEIDSKELARMKKYGYQLGDIVGLAGVERYYDKYLKGINGGKPMEVDPLGNPVRSLASQEPVPGSSLRLTIDLDLQRYAEKVFGDRRGAVVIVKPSTGEILTMFSKPDYNPNFFTDFLTEAEWRTIRTQEFPLHNRAVSGYPPGSIFKVITTMTGFEAGVINFRERIQCPGYFRLSGRFFNCWKHTGHGSLDFIGGFINSCNVVFYNLALKLDPDRIAKTAAGFGLGLATGIDLPYEATGSIPTSRWKQRKYNQPWFPGDSLNMAIGQGYVLTTPLQMAMVVASLANPTNDLMRPYLVKNIVSIDDKELYAQKPESRGRLPFRQDNITMVKKLMGMVVSRKGTGINALIPGFPMAGKTGTAEVFGSKKDHAWFICYGPTDQPEIASVVFVEYGGFGGEVAAGVTREIYQWWAENRSPRGAR